MSRPTRLQVCVRDMDRRISRALPDGEPISTVHEPSCGKCLLCGVTTRGQCSQRICERAAQPVCRGSFPEYFKVSVSGGWMPPRLLQGAENAAGGGLLRTDTTQNQHSLQPPSGIHSTMRMARKYSRVRY